MPLMSSEVPRKRPPTPSRARDLAIEVLIALGIVAVILYAAHAAPHHEADFRWVVLAGASAVTFGYPLRWSRRLWHRPRFWGAWVGLLCLHLAAYVAVLLSVSHFGFLWFAIITPAEWVVICPILDRAGGSGPGGPHKHVARR
jgi:hypothetical protein